MGSIVVLFFYIFSVVSMNLFGNVRRNYYLKRHANFEDFPNSFLMLFRITGGENWCAPAVVDSHLMDGSVCRAHLLARQLLIPLNPPLACQLEGTA